VSVYAFFCPLIARLCIFVTLFSKELWLIFDVISNTNHSLFSSSSSPLANQSFLPSAAVGFYDDRISCLGNFLSFDGLTNFTLK